jgi:hypothetical protein
MFLVIFLELKLNSVYPSISIIKFLFIILANQISPNIIIPIL